MSQLHYSEYSPINEKTSEDKRNKRGTTRKRRGCRINKKVETFLKSMEGMENESDLADFKPPPKPELTKQKKLDNSPKSDVAQTYSPSLSEDTEVKPHDYTTFNNEEVNNQYYQQYVPYYTQLSNQQQVQGDKSQLLEKLNYMIHLLEDQQEHKTDNITEELILYMFLGVFVIFVVDSFARAGKYTR